MATTYLTDTQGTPTNNLKWTWSSWIKRGELATEGHSAVENIFTTYVDASNLFYIRFEDTDEIYIRNIASVGTGGKLITNRVFRDPSAWYHVVVVYDSANASAGDRMRLYVNGVEETSFSLDTNPDSSQVCTMNADTRVVELGRRSDEVTNFTGILAHTHFCDGQAYAASDFGETDATSGIWIPITGPSVTYGNNGFFLKYAAGALGTDSSGESNDFVVSGTMTNTKDTPDNNFCTINPLDDYYQESTYSNGNTKVVTESGSAVYAFNTATMGVSTGKWYWEVKYTNSTAGGAFMYGVAAEMATSASTELGQTANQIGLLNNDTTRTNDTATAFGDGDYTTGDIMMCALDMTNSRIFFGKNGVWMTPSAGSGGDPTDGTGNVALPTAVASTPMGVYLPAFGPYVNASQTYEVNFGNGYFGTTLDGTNADDAGIGLFKYDVPAGYYALCTNNLGDQS